MTRLLVIGAGGYGRAVAEVAIAGDEHQLVGFVDDHWPDLAPVWGLPVLGRLVDLPRLAPLADAVAPAIGNNATRRAACALAQSAGFGLANVIHPRAIISPSAGLGLGLTVMAGAVIGTEAHSADGALVNTGAVVDHHARVGAFAHVGVGTRMASGSVLAPAACLRAG